jgi:SCY1-like protein 1
MREQTYGSLVPNSARYSPPEISKSGWESIRRNPLAAVDAYGLGILIFEVFNGSYQGSDQLGKTMNIPPSMHQSYRKLCSANPKLRLSPTNFVDQGKKIGGFFETPLIRLTDDVERLGLKNDEEREKFIKYVFVTRRDWVSSGMKALITCIVN